MNTDFTFCEGARALRPCPLRDECKRFIGNYNNLPEQIWQLVEAPFKSCMDDKKVTPVCYDFVKIENYDEI